MDILADISTQLSEGLHTVVARPNSKGKKRTARPPLTLVNARLVGHRERFYLVGFSAGKRHSLGRGTIIAEHRPTLSADIAEAVPTATPLKVIELER